MIRPLNTLLIIFAVAGCEILQQLPSGPGPGSSGPPSRSEITKGIREALIVGTTKAVLQTSKEDGFLANPSIRIPFPPEAEKVATTLRDIGMGDQVDQFVATMNHGAEKAAAAAKPIFVEAIQEMTLNDVYDIWRGDQDAATQYLQRTTGPKLKEAFRPVIKQALDQVELTRYWKPVIETYNQIPLTKKVNPNLDDYVLDETLAGLFSVIAKEEAAIRENPQARISDILKRVFGYSGP